MAKFVSLPVMFVPVQLQRRPQIRRDTTINTNTHTYVVCLCPESLQIASLKNSCRIPQFQCYLHLAISSHLYHLLVYIIQDGAMSWLYYPLYRRMSVCLPARFLLLPLHGLAQEANGLLAQLEHAKYAPPLASLSSCTSHPLIENFSLFLSAQNVM
jgi:hypothetical protein